MWPYWLLFVVPASASLSERARQPGAGGRPGRAPRAGVPRGLLLYGLMVALMIGWRHEVGGDWLNYLENFQRNAGLDLPSIVRKGDPGYQVLEWVAHRFEWDVYGINLMAGSIFAYGLIRFCNSLPRPWLALVAAVPYLIIVLGMGYSRQGIALGCLMAGFVAQGKGRVRSFVAWALLAATFHKSAVLVIPMAALGAARGRLWTMIWVGVVTAAAFVLLVQDSTDVLVQGYLVAEYQSAGALVRLWMNAVPGLFLVAASRRFDLPLAQARLWFWYAMAAVAALGAFYFSPSSTAVDRLALYLLPLQLVVASYFPDVVGGKGRANQSWVAAAVALYAAVQFVWFNFGNYAYTWLPYQFYPFVMLR
jgi:hypothetical protein